MSALIKAEFLKLLTLRSTYVTGLLGLAFILFMSFFMEGLKVPIEMLGPQFVGNLVTNIANTVSVFAAITAALLMLNEYRYNTITYTLTACRSRSYVLLAKIIVTIVYSTLYTVFCMLCGFIANAIGLSLADIQLPPQDVNMFGVISSLALFGAANGLLGLLFAALFRNITPTIAALFFVPTIIEGLIGARFPAIASYLPFTALFHTVATDELSMVQSTVSRLESAGIFSLYLLLGWVIAFVLFQRRDAN